jgi:hypothetical protein
MRSALSLLVYNKSLRISGAARQETSTGASGRRSLALHSCAGEAVNVLGVDVARVSEGCLFLHNGLAAPMTVSARKRAWVSALHFTVRTGGGGTWADRQPRGRGSTWGSRCHVCAPTAAR